MSIVLSEDQQRAVDTVLAWRDDHSRQTLTLGGYAGTGKTTVVRELIQRIGARRVQVCAYTGKAVSVLKRKGVVAQTMHSLMYTVQNHCTLCKIPVPAEVCPSCHQDRNLKTRWTRVHAIDMDCEVVIVDEASMLSERLVSDVEDLAPKVLYVGDHGQLEPIGDDPGIMRAPEVRLEQIHRQAEGSGIIQFAHEVRQERHPGVWRATDDVEVRLGIRGVKFSDYDVVLCGYNKARVAVNKRVRKERGFEGLVNEGERLICLQNDSDLGVFNGMLVTVTKVDQPNDDFVLLDFEDEMGSKWAEVPVLKRQFNQERTPRGRFQGLGVFDYGYAMTVHKSQGSEWNKVAVLEQISTSWTASRWRYTAATRAAKQLHYYLSEKHNQ